MATSIETEQTTNYEYTGSLVDPKSYQREEKKARWYLKELQGLVASEDYLKQLETDFLDWQNDIAPMNRNSLKLSSLETNQNIDSWSFLQKLSAERKLREYLDKSVTYIFMRDLGKSLDNKSVIRKINKTVTQLNRWIVNQANTTSNASENELSNLWLFKKAKQYGVETTFYWLMNKLSLVQQNMPAELNRTQGMRKLVKIIAGVVMHQFIDMPDDISEQKRQQQLDQAIRLGYSYGLTYPFIDDLQDSNSALTSGEKQQFNQTIRKSILDGNVADFPDFGELTRKKMIFVYNELSEAFSLIKKVRSKAESKLFFEQAFIFFEAQDIDRQRKLTGKSYSIEQLFLPIILKSSGSRLIAKELLNVKGDERFNYHTFCFGIYNQFNDDIKDIYDDIAEDNVTPYTYHIKQAALIDKSNKETPYRIYWSVVFYLIHNVYRDQPKCKKLLLERSINAHKSLLSTVGELKYKELKASLLSTGNLQFDQLIDKLVKEPNDVAWFDKLISRHVATHFETQQKHREEFKQRYQSIRNFVRESIIIPPHPKLSQSVLVEAANYSLQAGGKNIRAVIAYVMCVDKYDFSPEQTKPILQLLEYMHTASIIFDDKPSQDDSDIRRGKPTIHKKYNSEATAELTGVFMMMKAVEQQSSIQSFPAQQVLESLCYAASTTQAICEGQLMDLRSENLIIDCQQLELISELKTGLAIEAAIMIPAILVGENDIEKGHIKQLCKHIGIAFQIKDDLLDHSGNSLELGKPTGQDEASNKASFVNILGESGAQQKLYFHYSEAIALAKHLGGAEEFVLQIIDFVVYRQS